MITISTVVVGGAIGTIVTIFIIYNFYWIFWSLLNVSIYILFQAYIVLTVSISRYLHTEQDVDQLKHIYRALN